jgi:hypothetical protein
MTTPILFLLLVLLPFELQSKVNWVTQVGGTYEDIGKKIAVDDDGHIAVAGSFRSDSLRVDGKIYKNNGQTDIFLGVLDSNGKFLWTHGFGGTDLDDPADIVYDNNGNFVFVGSFSSKDVYFLNEGKLLISYNEMPGDSFSSRDIFVIKYTKLGKLVWAIDIGGGAYESVKSVSADIDGNIYLTGIFRGDKNDFDPTLNEYVLPYRAKQFECFVAKYSPEGRIIWAKAFGAGDNGIGMDIDVSSSQCIYISGMFVGDSVDFDPEESECFLRGTNGTWNGFLLKSSTAGKFVWAKSISLSGDTYVDAVSTLKDLSVVVGGRYKNNPKSTVDTTGKTYPFSGGGLDAFVCKYDGNGNMCLLGGISGAGFEYLFDIAVDNNDGVHIAGATSSQVVGFNLKAFNSKMHLDSSYNGFIANYDSDLNLRDVEIVSATNTCSVNGVAISPAGSVLGIGTILGGEGSLEGMRITGDNQGDMFIISTQPYLIQSNRNTLQFQVGAPEESFGSLKYLYQVDGRRVTRVLFPAVPASGMYVRYSGYTGSGTTIVERNLHLKRTVR